jgi:DHA2 family multidrug resistance protein-like MFS transporter
MGGQRLSIRHRRIASSDGAVGEMVGFRRVFQLGIIVFTLGSLGCTFAHSLPMLAFARALQGFGAAGIMSQNGALVRFTYPSGCWDAV